MLLSKKLQRKILLVLLVSHVLITIDFIKADADPKLDFAFLLHANQANVPYGDVANDLCYNAVIKTMLDHPKLSFPLHFSGSLLTDLMWFNDSTINLIRSGVNSGQFELLGSTYAQNIMYSNVDDYDNALQIEKHKEVIKKVFDYEPMGFWNPERCWNQQRYVNLITDGGYEYTFVEDHILNDTDPFDTPYDEYKVRKTFFADKELLVINDDKEVIGLVDNIAFTTKGADSPEVVTAVDVLIDYLHDIYLNDTNDDYLVFYGQDMEVWGLWQEEGRPYDTLENTIGRLDYLFTRLEEESDWLNIVTPGEFLEALPSEYEFEVISNIVDGTAKWMEAPTKAEGFKDWFDFSENDSRLNLYREQFQITRDVMKEVSNIIENSASNNIESASKLMDYAEYVFVANQFEFGCVGCYFPFYYRTKTALITVEAARYALDPVNTTEILVRDLDFDGSNEYILRNNKSMYVFTGLGGRLINWYDIENGIVLLSNDIPNSYASVSGLDYPNSYLSSPIGEVTGQDLWGRTKKSYNIRPKAFYESFEDGEYSWIWKSRNRSVIVGTDFVQFIFDFSGRIISKVFQIDPFENLLKVKYKIVNNEDNVEIKPIIGLSFSPSNTAILYQGTKALFEVLKDDGVFRSFSLWNVEEPVLVNVKVPSDVATQMKLLENDPMFALGYQIDLRIVSPKQSLEFEIELKGEISAGINNTSIMTATTTKPLKYTITIIPSFIAIISLILSKRKRRI